MATADRSHAFHGIIIHSTSLHSLTILENALLVVNPSGQIASLEASIPPDQVPTKLASLNPRPGCPVTYMPRGQFLIPGFVDTHHHAPQWLHRGQGQGLHILEWLDQVAFPNEARFQDASHAERVYSDVVCGMLRQGVTTASYYGSKHGEATKILADICLSRGQRALVGKCNMSRNAPDYYRDKDEDESLQVTLDCINHIKTIDPRGELVRHVLTPRFAICCEAKLLSGLGDIAKKYPDMPIQTHFNESEQEKNATLTLFPEFTNEADLYQHFGLLNERSILAHCTIMTDYETKRLAQLKCGVAHCPTANMTIGGGFMAAPVKEFLRNGIKVGLGTDSGGGYSSSMLNAMQHSLVASFARDYLDTRDGRAAVSFEEVFHMATLGGAQVVGFDAEVGNFEQGKEFDALVVDVTREAGGVNAPLEDDDSVRTILEKFVMTGDDRNIRSVFVKGRRVHGV
ncbi:amidohydrolase family domain-containing protein [Pochonia chlamydosporia 170]|uniref:Probable guanine deaminase n=1 Tax=Pochonia chlamydosporia 170 TaxID=1380566 RepID=A0A179F197_METCM|nr:amidohydrolase family domain-containing protein [Pochonia chlamydosporia 170]OAQ59235.1 amidohydrolase family domain-containing protein [Pochonia chlamydosporia 170]